MAYMFPPFQGMGIYTSLQCHEGSLSRWRERVGVRAFVKAASLAIALIPNPSPASGRREPSVPANLWVDLSPQEEEGAFQCSLQRCVDTDAFKGEGQGRSIK